MIYKEWNLKIEGVHIQFHGIREFVVIAIHYREIHTPQLENSVPYLGRMTRREVCPLKLEFRGTSLRQILTEAKHSIDEIGPIPWIVYNDPWAKETEKNT